MSFCPTSRLQHRPLWTGQSTVSTLCCQRRARVNAVCRTPDSLFQQQTGHPALLSSLLVSTLSLSHCEFPSQKMSANLGRFLPSVDFLKKRYSPGHFRCTKRNFLFWVRGSHSKDWTLSPIPLAGWRRGGGLLAESRLESSVMTTRPRTPPLYLDRKSID